MEGESVKKYTIIILLLLSIPIAFSADITTYEDTFFVDDQVFFQACNYNTLDVSCLDSNDLNTFQLSQDCDAYGFEASDLTCPNPIITADETTSNLRLLDFTTSLQSSIDFRTEQDFSIAQKLYGNYLLGNEDKIDEYTRLLRDSRLEDEKCWGGDECDLELTADVLKMLSDSGFNRSNRIYHDAMLWLESRQNPETMEETRFVINTSSSAECFVDFESGPSITFDNQSSELIIEDYNTDSDVEFRCDRSYCVEVTDRFGEELYSSCASSNRTRTFYLDRGCWGEQRDECDRLVSATSLSLHHLRESNFDDGLDWVERNKEPVPIDAERVPSSEEVLSNLYFYQATGFEDIKTWLWYTQNNEGSFSRDDKVGTTLEALYVFQEDNAEEWIQDASEWALDQRSLDGWNNVLYDSRSLQVFGPSRSPINTNPLAVTVDGTSKSFELVSEEEFEASVETTNTNVQASVENFGNRAEVTLSLITEDDGLYGGDVIITTNPYEKIVPFSINNLPTIDFDLEGNYYFEEAIGSIDASITKSDSTFECDITFNDAFEDTTVTITNQNRVSFDYEVEEAGTYDVTMRYSCDTGLDHEVTGETFFTLRVYPFPPVEVGRNFETMNEEPGEFIIRNNLPEDINVELGFSNNVDDYTIESPIFLEENIEASVFTYKTIPSELELLDTNNLVVRTVGYEERVPFEVQLNEITHEAVPTEYREISSFPWVLTVFLLAIISIILLVIYYVSQKPTTKEHVEEDESSTTEEKEIEEDDKALGETLAAVEQASGADKEQISEDLKQEGYKDADIEDILKDLEELGNPQEEEETPK